MKKSRRIFSKAISIYSKIKASELNFNKINRPITDLIDSFELPKISGAHIGNYDESAIQNFYKNQGLIYAYLEKFSDSDENIEDMIYVLKQFMIDKFGPGDVIVKNVSDDVSFVAIIPDVVKNKNMFLNAFNENMEIIPKGTILYHGSKTGKLVVDFEKENYLYFTDNFQMASDYALKQQKNYEYKLASPSKKNEDTLIVIKCETTRDLKMIRFDEDLTLRKIPFSRNELYAKVKEYGFDGVINYEIGFSATGKGGTSMRAGFGDSYYVFNLHDINVVDYLKPTKRKS